MVVLEGGGRQEAFAYCSTRIFDCDRSDQHNSASHCINTDITTDFTAILTTIGTSRMHDLTQHCHCGSGITFQQCCEPLLSGMQNADSAERLMRSRYSGFATNAFDYLIRTHHASKRQPEEHAQLQAQAKSLRWLALNICDTKDGRTGQTSGEVEFKAFFRIGGGTDSTIHCLHERSLFLYEKIYEQTGEQMHGSLREKGQWFYVDAIFCNDLRVNLGRNDLCFCGGGRKFKQCHGR